MNCKTRFISIFLSAGIILSSPLIFASGKSSKEKKPSKASFERKVPSIKSKKTLSSILKKLLFAKNEKTAKPEEKFVSIETEEIVEPKQFSFYKFPSSKIVLPQAVRLKFGAFSECYELTDVSMPAVKEIGWFAFMGCSNLKNVEMPNVEEISCCAFVDCPSLEKVDLKNIKKIGNSVFVGCKNLKKVIISDDVSVVSRETFEDCSDDLTIIYKGLPLSKKGFFSAFEGDTEPNVTVDEVRRLFMASEKK